MQDLDEPRHVRALEVVRQAHVHVERGDGVLLAGGAILDPHRMADVLDADAVDGNARVSARPCTSSTSVRTGRAVLALAGGGVMYEAYRIGVQRTYLPEVRT